MQTGIERADAERVVEALTHLRNGNRSEAERTLREVCSRCPDSYEYEFTTDGTRHLKFWDVNEFMAYVAAHGQERAENIVWWPSAYPRACYHLAFLLVEKRDFAGAIGWLQKGRSMEPRNPRFLLELGVAHAQLQAYEQSYDCYRQAYELASDSALQRAVALRGMGVQLINLERLDEAEARLRESLSIDRDNESAKHELEYIGQLRSAGKRRQ
jgi:tetratricopeptide (TPR) repeat protein